MRCYHSGSEWAWERWQWRGTLYPLSLQHYWDLTIRLFSVISWTLVVGGVLPLCREAVSVFYSPNRPGKSSFLCTFLFVYIYIYIYIYCTEEHDDFISTNQEDPPNEFIGYDTKPSELGGMWSSLLKLLLYPLWPVVVVPVRFSVSVSLINGISTLFRLFNAKTILLEEH